MARVKVVPKTRGLNAAIATGVIAGKTVNAADKAVKKVGNAFSNIGKLVAASYRMQRAQGK
jgi:hypothetical protein